MSNMALACSTGKSSLKISRKLAGVGAAPQPLIRRREQSGIADAHRGDGNRFVVQADEKLTAFLELERVTRQSLRFPNAEGQEIEL